MKIGIKFLIGAIFLLIGVLIGIILKVSYNSIEISTYILIGANILMIFLMLGTILYMEKSTREHINAVEESSREQINTMRRWSNIKRKQLIKSLIEEIKHNVILYNQFVESEKKGYSQQFFNFIFVSMEKCLSDSPIDKEDINHNILVMYYLIKTHDSKISATRTPNIHKDSLKGFIDSIIKDYKEDKWLFKSTVEMLEEYEKNIKIKD